MKLNSSHVFSQFNSQVFHSIFTCFYPIVSVRLIQVGNNRNDHFRYFLGVHVRLIKVSFTENKGNKFGDFSYCPLNRGCPLNTVSA